MIFEKILSNKGNLISDLYLFTPKIFEDTRGGFYESWNKNIFNNIIGKEIEFVQDNQSISRLVVLRGLHYQTNPFPQGKLVRSINGEIFDVAVDLRKNSKTFGEWASVILNDQNKKQFWIPEGFAHGFLTLTNNAIVLYKATNFWKKEHEKSILWNDKKLSIDWPFHKINSENPNLSIKDKNALGFEEAILNSEIFL